MWWTWSHGFICNWCGHGAKNRSLPSPCTYIACSKPVQPGLMCTYPWNSCVLAHFTPFAKLIANSFMQFQYTFGCDVINNHTWTFDNPQLNKSSTETSSNQHTHNQNRISIRTTVCPKFKLITTLTNAHNTLLTSKFWQFNASDPPH